MSEQFLIEEKAYTEFTQSGEIDRISTFQYRVIKRGFDLLLAVVSVPFFLLIGVPMAILIRISSHGPIFYREFRIGQYGKPFCIWKFRTMYEKEEQEQRMREAKCTDQDHSRLYKHLGDPRITPIGRTLRRWSLDELPQFLNVLRGEMAMIGPRPIVEEERKLYGPGFDLYCSVRPGISGLWQISGRSCLGHGERVLLDCQYVRDWSLTLDLTIFLKTFRVVVTAQGAY